MLGAVALPGHTLGLGCCSENEKLVGCDAIRTPAASGCLRTPKMVTAAPSKMVMKGAERKNEIRVRGTNDRKTKGSGATCEIAKKGAARPRAKADDRARVAAGRLLPGLG